MCVGVYYSIFIWVFWFKYNICGGELEVWIDLKNIVYVVMEGGRKWDIGEGKDEEEGLEGGRKILMDGEREELRKSVFKRLEWIIEDCEVVKEGNERFEGLMDKV